jgi:hypothetical protein
MGISMWMVNKLMNQRRQPWQDVGHMLVENLSKPKRHTNPFEITNIKCVLRAQIAWMSRFYLTTSLVIVFLFFKVSVQLSPPRCVGRSMAADHQDFRWPAILEALRRVSPDNHKESAHWLWLFR